MMFNFTIELSNNRILIFIKSLPYIQDRRRCACSLEKWHKSSSWYIRLYYFFFSHINATIKTFFITVLFHPLNHRILSVFQKQFWKKIFSALSVISTILFYNFTDNQPLYIHSCLIHYKQES